MCEHPQWHVQAWDCIARVGIQTYLSWNIYVYFWHMYVCKDVLTVSTRNGTDICEFAQHEVIHKSICNMKYVYLWVCPCIQKGFNMGSHIRVFLIWCMYTCDYLHIYKEVLTMSTRKGTNICEFATRVHIQNYPWYDVCILSKCEHPQWHVQVWDCTARVDIPTYLWWNISILVTYVCMQRGSKCEHGQGHRHMWVRTTWAHIQMNLWCDLCSLVSTYTKRF